MTLDDFLDPPSDVALQLKDTFNVSVLSEIGTAPFNRCTDYTSSLRSTRGQILHQVTTNDSGLRGRRPVEELSVVWSSRTDARAVC